MTTPIDVAVGVLIRDDDSFLLAERPPGKPMAGWWEFPGGKLEPGESVFDALVREFDEELGLRVADASPWVRRVVAYPHATVRLHFWRSFGEGVGWCGEPTARERQNFRWERIECPTTEPWLEGALPVKRWLRLPPFYAISDASTMGIDAFLASLDRCLADGSVRQLQLREPAMEAGAFDALFASVRSKCEAAGARLLVNSAHPPAYWGRCDGVHLASRDLMRMDVRPAVDWCLASCHDPAQLARAGALDLDAVVLGPVRPTASHPGAATLGWPGFAAIARATSLPVYALGGLDRSDLAAARDAGAHGVAAIRAAWALDFPEVGPQMRR